MTFLSFPELRPKSLESSWACLIPSHSRTIFQRPLLLSPTSFLFQATTVSCLIVNRLLIGLTAPTTTPYCLPSMHESERDVSLLRILQWPRVWLIVKARDLTNGSRKVQRGLFTSTFPLPCVPGILVSLLSQECAKPASVSGLCRALFTFPRIFVSRRPSSWSLISFTS